ncbi:hypothetical protein [Parafilimonas sp.]|uniref:hypothetical protein n=1 Tax=Parafilimonas sp. TaxID=1969739 RepID=UPI0039E3F5D2
MLNIEEQRERIVNTVKSLPEDKLNIIEDILKKLQQEEHSIDEWFEIVAAQYGSTLRRLAQ